VQCFKRPRLHGGLTASTGQGLLAAAGCIQLRAYQTLARLHTLFCAQVAAANPGLPHHRLRLERLLAASFMYLGIGELRDVPLAAMEKLDQVRGGGGGEDCVAGGWCREMGGKYPAAMTCALLVQAGICLVLDGSRLCTYGLVCIGVARR
jgi:hypothetical protein